LFPYREQNARVLFYEYNANSLMSPFKGSSDRILALATTFIEELCADRQTHGAINRPIIFICHGFGGLLVKSALVLANSMRSVKVQNLRSIYVCTYALLFMGTPHHGMQKAVLSLPLGNDSSGPSQFLINLIKSDMLQDITDQFAPLMKRYVIFNFWEEMETVVEHVRTLVVHHQSAAPTDHEARRCGIRADHSGMVKFRDQNAPGYQVLRAALEQYIAEAPPRIKNRRKNDRREIGREWREQASVLEESGWKLERAETDLPSPVSITRGDWRLSRMDTGMSSPPSFNRYFMARGPVKHYTGRISHMQQLVHSFGTLKVKDSKAEPKIFVVHGMGGSGKTQFAKNFCFDNKNR
jgi:hypothetical protein